ncbi:MAG TPA: DUF362 domain-containing protein, partial [Armatimonadota bacterium]|nr:DUF362 domain-containing protein [Armatimonadota bacterium]
SKELMKLPENTIQRAIVGISRITDRKMKLSSVEKTVRDAISLVGGIDKYVREGQIVALKPNQTLFKLATDGSTTSPRMIQALIKICKEAGAKDVWVMEAAGHAQMTRHVCAITGMTSAVKEAGGRMIFLDEIAHKVVDFGEDARVRFMPVPEVLDRVDVIINCPKAKTHFVDPISCACKNWVGLMPMNTRLELQRDADPYYWGNAQLLKRYRPTLNICDGMVAGQGQGPGSNKPFWWGYILASDDPVAMDVTLAQLFSLDWKNIRMAKEAAELGVGVYNPRCIEIAGVPIKKAQVDVEPADTGVNKYPCRVIVGEGANIEGTLGHWKTIADAWLDAGLWKLFTSKGTPTIMFGNAEDPDFEKHVKEGPYIVLDDSAQDKYKFDHRVTYIPGNPVPQSYMQHEMVEGMGFGQLYEPGLRLYEQGKKYKGQALGAAGEQARKRAIAGGVIAATITAAAIAIPAIVSGRQAVESQQEEEEEQEERVKVQHGI